MNHLDFAVLKNGMATQRLPLRLHLLRWGLQNPSPYKIFRVQQQRPLSTDAEAPSESNSTQPQSNESTSSDLSDQSTFSSHTIPGPSDSQIASFDPVGRSRARKTQLPPSRYSFRPPKYARGPLHPIQPPPPSSPASRLFTPGPFSLPRLQQTYTSTLAADLMTLHYQHIPPGTPQLPVPQRLRSWDDSSPYYKNRPLRGPRGKPVLPLLKKAITFRNVPQLTRITVSSLVRDAAESSAHLHVAGMALQAITTQRVTVHMARRSLAKGQRISFTQKAGKPIALSTTLQGEAMWHFLSTLTGIVLPRLKDWPGIKGSSGDRSGNLGIGLRAEHVGLWPELEVNYDSYPPHMIPGLDIILHTTASNDRDARLLLSGLGLPFDGKQKH